MNNPWVWAGIAAAVSCPLVLLIALLYRKGRTTGEIRFLGLGFKLHTDGTKESSPGVKIDKVASRNGKIVAQDNTGCGAEVTNADAKGDIVVSSAPQRGRPHPKANPPI